MWQRRSGWGTMHRMRKGRPVPLVLVGGRSFTPAAAVERTGGAKYAALVAAGHSARIALSRRARAGAALTYADSAHGARAVADVVRVVRFERCSSAGAKSRSGGRRVSLWSGFILTSGPRCVRLKVWIDGSSRARRARIPIGRRC